MTFIENPIKGGRPPKDMIAILKRSFSWRLISLKLILFEVSNLNLVEVQTIKIIMMEYIIKYRIVIFRVREAMKISHPEWAIDEYVKIIFVLNWLSPPKAPTIADKEAIRGRSLIFIKRVSISKGATFCQVKRIRIRAQLIFLATCGNHIWSGATPIFNLKDRKIIVSEDNNNVLRVKEVSIRKKINRKVEANAWIIKYLIEASVSL